jgi:hypothetical protein
MGIEMQADRSPTAARHPIARSSITNRPSRTSVSGRSRVGRRIRDIADQFAHALGGWQGLTDLQASACRRAAELLAISEAERKRALSGEASISIEQLIRLDRLARLAVRDLHLGRKRKPSPASPLDALLLPERGDDGDE